jgi:Cys-tRNA(Pro)/Cys-tRNA(Cys) deacylase
MIEKTVAMKVLEGRGVEYEARTYPDGERDAVQVAAYLGVPAGQVFKTLVVTRDRGKPMLVMIPADRQLNLKRLAKAVGEKKVKMAAHEEAEKLTGLAVGGISPLALLHKPFVIFLDQSARELGRIFISAGKKGVNLGVPVTELAEITHAKFISATG